MEGQPQVNSYDEVPYPEYPHAFTHPRHLETMATLFGMQPPPIRTARVLELGCAAGTNLIPQAIDLPEATFLGIDSSQGQIDVGRQVIDELGLTNIELRRADILDVDDSWDRFDYILCHGVLSWVRPNVQEKILDVFRANLAPSGVAFVSYNAYPGCHLARIARDTMGFHAMHFDSPEEKILHAKALLEFIAGDDKTDPLHAEVLRRELQILNSSAGDSYVYHDYLESYNQPFYFVELMNRVYGRGLQFLSETDLATMLPQNYSLPEQFLEKYASLPPIKQEQYLDFLCCRRFRRTLLCHQEVQLNRSLSGAVMPQFHVALSKMPKVDKAIEDNLGAGQPVTFKTDSTTATIDGPLPKAALAHLISLGQHYISFEDLHRAAIERLPADSQPTPEQLAAHAEAFAGNLLRLYSTGLLQICLNPPLTVRQLSDYPIASPLVRRQAAEGRPLTNQFHDRVEMDDLCRHLVHRLDGKHDRAALVRSLCEAVKEGQLTVKERGKPMEKVPPPIADRLISRALKHVSDSGLLIR